MKIEKKIIESLTDSIDPKSVYKIVNGKMYFSVAHIDLDSFVQKIKDVIKEQDSESKV